ncbi:MAG TPA: N4-gp56 family major capsid protein [Steroidobacteraceae bacterium]|nr:N4-gp56 family major capsid protein [Steroidobacteraceae bacterium]
MPGNQFDYLDPGLSTSQTLINNIVPLWFQEELLLIAEKLTVFQDIGETPQMPEGEGKTYAASRYERLPLPGAPLVEGVTPDSTPLVVNKVTAVLEQWGMVVTISDVGLMITKHPALQAAKDRLANASAELQDREIQRVLMGGGVVVMPNAKTSRSTLVAGDTPGTDFISGIVATLRQLGAPTFAGSMYAGVFDPYVEQDLAKDPTFVLSHQYAETTALFNAEVGRWRGVRWKRSNLLPITKLLATGAGGVAAAASTTIPTGTTGFAAGSTVRVTASLADPTSGLDSQQVATTNVTNAAAFVVTFTVDAAAPEGRYNFYVSQPGGTTPLLAAGNILKPAGQALTYTVAAGMTAAVGNTSAASASGAAAGADPPAGGITVHIGYIFGKQAFAVPALGARTQAMITAATATDSDPLAQRRKCGFKFMTKTCILNPDFYRRFECTSAFS